MPAFNCADFIKESIDSVINQTYTNWELIIINDCSTDNTKEILDTFSDERIRIYNNEKNYGVAYSRNKGISLSSGKWIAFIDSDDLWDASKLKKQLDFINDEKNFIFTGSKFINEKGEQKNYVLKVPLKINKEELLKQNLISCSSVLINKEIISKYRFPDEIKEIHEDYATWLTILSDIKYAYGINEPLLIYRLRTKSKSFNKLKALKMNWNVYKYIKLPFFESIKNMISYGYRNAVKYCQISIGK